MIVVIPTAREVRLEYLEPLIDAGCRFIVVDDSPGGRVEIGHPQFEVHSWADQDRLLGELAIAIPRGNGACRDYGFLLAWRDSDPGEIIVALDDDCLVFEPEFVAEVEAALSLADRPHPLTTARHWNALDLYDGTPDGLFPRGFPYSARVDYRRVECGGRIRSAPLFHLGLWRGIFDVNAIDKLEGPAYEHPDARLTHDSVVVPGGTLISACSMNMMFRREVIPAVYQLPMAVDVMPGWRIDRYGDIWGGFILKTLLDIRGEALSVGAPMIRHLKEGNFHRNIWQEHLCHLVNDEFDELLAGFDGGGGAADASHLELMGRLADHLRAAAPAASPMLAGYLDHLACAMDAWVAALARCSPRG